MIFLAYFTFSHFPIYSNSYAKPKNIYEYSRSDRMKNHHCSDIYIPDQSPHELSGCVMIWALFQNLQLSLYICCDRWSRALYDNSKGAHQICGWCEDGSKNQWKYTHTSYYFGYSYIISLTGNSSISYGIQFSDGYDWDFYCITFYSCMTHQ